MPLSLLAHGFPQVLPQLRAIAALERLPDYPSQFALRNPERELPPHRTGLERRIFEALTPVPRPVSELVRNRAGLDALRRLADGGYATIAAFTPSDAMHVLGRQNDWNREAAECGARILATEERNGRAARGAATPQAVCERTYEHVVQESGRALLSAAFGLDPGLETRAERRESLGARLIDAAIAGRRLSALVAAPLTLAQPLVAIGAPAAAYYPEVARRLAAPLSVPEHASVCNAVGAVAGVVAQSVEVLVNQPSFKVFRVHDPAGSRDYAESEPALEHARRASRELALAAAPDQAGAACGQTQRTRVPPALRGPICSVPPRMPARYSMIFRPIPPPGPGVPAPKPTPSSATLRLTALRVVRRLTQTVRAAPCLAALISASWAIRYMCMEADSSSVSGRGVVKRSCTAMP